MIELTNQCQTVELTNQCQTTINLTRPVLKGDDGGFYEPKVDENGNLTWVPSEKDMPAVEGSNIKGPQGIPGKTPIKGVDYFDGKNGLPGKDGKDGKTPIKGVDYFDGKDGKDGLPGKNGKDAKINGLNTITIAEGENISISQNGDTLTINAIGGGGGTGENGATFTPAVSPDGEISWTNDKGLVNPAPVNIQGKPGKDGKNGVDGKNGIDGTNGEDGFSPSAEILQTENGAKITITDKTGTTIATLNNGKDGKDGLPGKNGVDGLPGKDGKDGLDGKNGLPGEQGIQGERGPAGADAKINGLSAINITAGDNIKLSQTDDTLTISSTASGGGGTVQFATFDINTATGELVMDALDETTTPQFTINDSGNLEVEIL